MKHLLFTLTFLFSLSSFSQYLNGAPIEELDAEYIEIVGTQKLLKLQQVTIRVMFGQVSTAKDIPLSVLYTDETQKKRYPLNGMMGALNFFAKYGYEYVDAYTVSYQSQNVYHYLLRKRKE